jgi:hypothetical protein
LILLCCELRVAALELNHVFLAGSLGFEPLACLSILMRLACRGHVSIVGSQVCRGAIEVGEIQLATIGPVEPNILDVIGPQRLCHPLEAPWPVLLAVDAGLISVVQVPHGYFLSEPRSKYSLSTVGQLR